MVHQAEGRVRSVAPRMRMVRPADPCSPADGRPDHALCLDIYNTTADSSILLSGILASMTQTQVCAMAGCRPRAPIQVWARAHEERSVRSAHLRLQGTSSGWLFDPDTMQAFVDTPVGVRLFVRVCCLRVGARPLCQLQATL